ncbi:amino acid permease [uncultured Clostridium sp.]|uniref:amino acid permease n=1 Tax=uncultured Clostridium sp. TaxID=59620 RepID=UPI00263608B7|nr:amino acid permease [uncultured Clostridium sp.]
MKSIKKLSMFGFLFLTSSVLIEIYEYPTFAISGFSSIFYLIIGGVLWFLPVCLCAAEMATVEGFQEGGVFTWTSKTLGKKMGFAHIFYQFIVFTIGAVTMIYFIVGAIAYITGIEAINNNPIIKFIFVIAIFWIITYVQLKGIKKTALIAKVGFIAGIVIPAVVLFALTGIYLIKGYPIHIDMSLKTFIPDFSNMGSLVVLVSFMLSYMGLEVSATHINDMENPKRDYPRAIIIILFLCILLSSFGALSIGIVVPQSSLSLNQGVFQAYSILLSYFGNFGFIVKLLALLLCLGSIAEISAWIVGPTRGLSLAGEKGFFSKKIAKRNKNDVASNLLIIQGIGVTIWAFILTFAGGSSNNSFFMAMTLTVIVYLLAYGIFFIAYIKLTLKGNDLNRKYQIAKSKVVRLVIGIVGFVFTVIAFGISFIPPSGVKKSQVANYTHLLIIVFVLIVIIPFIITKVRKKHII